MERINKQNYYLDIAEAVLRRSTCLRRKYGAIIVKNDEIIATGYNGAPRGRKNCSDLGRCYRESLGIPHGHRYELCRSVHAEANALLSAPRDKMLGAALYLACRHGETDALLSGTSSCMMCRRLILNAGIAQVVIRETSDSFSTVDVSDWITNDDSLESL